MTHPTFPPNAIERWTFYSAFLDGPWIASTGRWDDPVHAAEAAASWIVQAAQAGSYPRVRVQTISELAPA